MNELDDNELRLMFEMIENGSFSGKGVEVVVSLKNKVLTEIEKREKAAKNGIKK